MVRYLPYLIDSTLLHAMLQKLHLLASSRRLYGQIQNRATNRISSFHGPSIALFDAGRCCRYCDNHHYHYPLDLNTVGSLLPADRKLAPIFLRAWMWGAADRIFLNVRYLKSSSPIPLKLFSHSISVFSLFLTFHAHRPRQALPYSLRLPTKSLWRIFNSLDTLLFIL